MANFEEIMKKFLESYEKQTDEALVKEFMVRPTFSCSSVCFVSYQFEVGRKDRC
jgi:hypothetical protein